MNGVFHASLLASGGAEETPELAKRFPGRTSLIPSVLSAVFN